MPRTGMHRLLALFGLALALAAPLAAAQEAPPVRAATEAGPVAAFAWIAGAAARRPWET